MLFLLPLTILLSQGLFGSAYVVLDEENGYYSTWRSNPVRSQSMQWPSFMSPQNYMPFMQNFNPFGWGQPTVDQDNREMELIHDRQLVIFKVIKCMVEQREMEACKKILDKSMVLFEEPLETDINKPIVIQSTVWTVKPVEVVSEDKPMPVVDKKPVEIVVVESPVPVTKPLEVELPSRLAEPEKIEMKPMEMTVVEMKPMDMKDVVEPVVEKKPMEMKPVVEMKPMDMKDVVEPVVQMKPMDMKDVVEPVVEMKPMEVKDVDVQMKPMEVQEKVMEVVPKEPVPMKLPVEEAELGVLRAESLDKPVEIKPLGIEPTVVA